MWFTGRCLCKLLAVTLIFRAASTAAQSTEFQLVEQLFEKYNKILRPVNNVSKTMEVLLYPALVSIIGTDETSETITFEEWFGMKWTDEYLRWNPNDFDGINLLNIPISQIWYPDIMAESVIDIKKIVPDARNNAVIDYSGNVTISLDQVVTMHCSYFVENFPFDVQNCTIKLSSWMYTANQLLLFPTIPSDLLSYKNNTDWDLISFNSRQAIVEIMSHNFSYVYYDIVIQRKPMFYITTFLVPSFIITTLSIVGVFSPFNESGEREEKVTMGLTTLLTMAVILVIITSQIPKTSDRMPILGLFMITQIALSAVATLAAVVNMYVHSCGAFGATVPGWLLTITRLTPAKFSAGQQRLTQETVVLKKVANRNANSIQEIGERSKIILLLEDLREMMHQEYVEDRKRELWSRATGRIDIMLLIIFTLLNFVSTIIYLVIGYSSLIV